MNGSKERVKVDVETGKGLIIDREAMVSKTRRLSEWTYNAAAWAFWLFLMRPLIITMLWYLGLRVAYYQMVSLQGIRNPEFFSFGFLALLAIFGAMLAWNRYNVYRFRGVERRKSRGVCEAQDLARYYRVAEEEVDGMRNSSRLDVYFDAADAARIDLGPSGEVKALYAPQKASLHFEGLKDGKP